MASSTLSVDPQYALDTFKTVLTKEYWMPDGRVHRKRFWHFFLVWFVIAIGCLVFNMLIPPLSVLSTLVMLALLAPTLSLAIRRVHDIGQPWFMAIIPFYNIYLATIAGDKGENEYGPDPLGPLAALG